MTQRNLPVDGKRLWDDLMALAAITDPDQPWTRRAFSPRFLEGREWLKRRMEEAGLEVRLDTDFDAVIDGCAAPRPGRRTTWINATIRDLYGQLFRRGHVHTVEAWRDGRLVGGLYGLELGAAFFGESMFSLERDASKVALVHLVAMMRRGGFQLLDTQFLTEHLTQFGALEIERNEYLALLEQALAGEANLAAAQSAQLAGAEALALIERTAQ